MVRNPKQYTISAGQAGDNTLLIPEFAGLDLLVERRGIGALLPSEIEILTIGGFSLVAPDVFNEGDVFTVTPLPTDYQFPYPTIPVYPATRYPHTLQMVVLEPSTQDASGDWEPGADSTIEYPCRIEPQLSSGDGLQAGQDGKVLNYAFAIYMPIGVPTLTVGARVTVIDGDLQVIASDTIKRFSRGQLNARAWL